MWIIVFRGKDGEIYEIYTTPDHSRGQAEIEKTITELEQHGMEILEVVSADADGRS